MSVSLDESIHLHWQGEGQALLLLHGWGMNGRVFDPFARLLAERGFRVGTVDLPGFGLSAPLEGGLSLEGLGDALLPHLPQGCVLAGWSLGGMVATQLALASPQRVSHLVTLASSPCFRARDGWPGIKPRVLEGFAQALNQDLTGTLERFVALQAMGSASARSDTKAIRALLTEAPEPDPQALAQGLEILRDADQRPALAGVRQPWLRIYGRLDALVPSDSLAPMARLTPESREAVLPKAAHAPFISHPQETADLIQSFLGSAAPA
ncbi:pimeloyl-ACP methyl ester esterase BioH [Ferrimonas sediminicola]|uniref:Pimeloyl-[acyl-carrier protein] methyl ester esterase n=1 Tax=Ferrimonas sediminicola TaxID=2569538 RepID=A0A4U1BA04_9GAMM|nr:pimeloyl-ACP methyl ester esterase BioH [Ferrimonas sediminicola]TKB47629.1 pimeloyl-ACP methyl ester esterase BioH [Ferrimonas sediminicola]